jgi:hypothetical protein
LHKIIVRLPSDRDYAGILEIQGPGGKTIAGPFDVCARADSEIARRNHNPSRNPLLPFGDVPLGNYRVAQIFDSGPRTSYPAEEFGSAGIVLLQPQSGEAVLADANGRFGFFIQAGRLSRKGALRPNDGSLRLSDRDLRKLLAVVRPLGQIDCACVPVKLASLKRKVLVAPSLAPEETSSDTPSIPNIPSVTRRSWLQTVLLSGASMAVPGALVFTSQAAYGQGAAGNYSASQSAHDQISQPNAEADAAAMSPYLPPPPAPMSPDANQDVNPAAKRRPDKSSSGSQSNSSTAPQ